MFTRTISVVVFAFLASLSMNTYSAQGYELFFNGKRSGHEVNMNIYQSIGNLQWNIKKYPHIKVKGYFNEKVIHATGKGYELYHNGRRVGFEPSWALKDAVKNLHWNQKEYQSMDVRGWYNGNKM